MKPSIPVILAFVLLAAASAPVQAGPGHSGPVAVEQTLYVHLLGDAMALHPSKPTSASLAPAQDAPACGEAQTWQAAFTRTAPTGTASGDPLATNASQGARPVLTWYVETVAPGTDQPLGAALPDLLLSAILRTGNNIQTMGDGTAMATFEGTVTPVAVTAGERNVYALEARLDWTGDPEFPAGEGLQLEVSLQVDNAACPTPVPGLRAYGDETNAPRVELFVFDAVRIDAFTGTWDNGTVTLSVRASSPWGPEFLAPIDPPVLIGNSGAVQGLSASTPSVTDSLEQTWTWQQGNAGNGTYRADVVVAAVDGSSQASDSFTFEVGGRPPPRPTPTTEAATDAAGEDAPATATGLLLVAVAAAGMVARRK